MVPNLKGETLAQATRRLSARGCRLGTVVGPKNGRIISQSPKPGRREKRHSRVRVTFAPIGTSSSVSVRRLDGYTLVGAGVYPSGSSQAASGLPVKYTILDDTSGQVAATFSGTSGDRSDCSLVGLYNKALTTQTWSGQAVSPYSGCSLASFTAPAHDKLVIEVQFAGNANYKASSESPALALIASLRPQPSSR